MRVQERWMLRAAAEQTDLAATWYADVLFEFQPVWPLRLWIGIGQCSPKLTDTLFEGYTRLRLGVHAGVLNWD